MISIVIPTRNRAYTLIQVLDSYYLQKLVDEIVIVDDYGNDNTSEIIESISIKYPYIKTKYIKHEKQKGASAGRITGYTNSKNKYILFGEDDAYLENNYTTVLLKKIEESKGIGIVSGRIIYKLYKEEINISLKRFQYGKMNVPIFDTKHFGVNIEAYFKEDVELPMTHALFLTKKELLQKFSYDPFYAQGNGYREESDFQINAFVNNYKVICTNDTHCFHLSREEVKTGGQRVNRLKQLYWNIYFTNYFYDKYFDRIKEKLHIQYNKHIAMLLFSISMFSILFIKPIKKVPFYLWRRFFK